jgi:hypothetical protein
MSSSSISLLVTIMLLLLSPSPACSVLSCRLDFTSVALLSCQETAPQILLSHAVMPSSIPLTSGEFMN